MALILFGAVVELGFKTWFRDLEMVLKLSCVLQLFERLSVLSCRWSRHGLWDQVSMHKKDTIPAAQALRLTRLAKDLDVQSRAKGCYPTSEG